MKCSQCGSDAATGAGTCPGCGTAIPTVAEAATLTQAGPAMAFPPEEPSINMTGLEREPEQTISQVAEAYRRLKEAEGRQPISDGR